MFPFTQSKRRSGLTRSRNNQAATSVRRTRRSLGESLERRELMAFTPVSVFSVGGVESDGGSKVAFDAAGNQYLYGNYRATVDFDPANSYIDNRDVLTSSGASDMFIAKYAPDGSLTWVRGFGNASVDQTTDGTEGLALDASGSIYAAAIFYGTVNYDGHLLTQLPGASGASNALLRLNPQGEVDWASMVGDGLLKFAVHDTASGPSVFAAGNILNSTSIAGIQVSASNATDGFLARINATTGQAD